MLLGNRNKARMWPFFGNLRGDVYKVEKLCGAVNNVVVHQYEDFDKDAIRFSCHPKPYGLLYFFFENPGGRFAIFTAYSYILTFKSVSINSIQATTLSHHYKIIYPFSSISLPAVLGQFIPPASRTFLYRLKLSCLVSGELYFFTF